jgi:thioredoxin-related protein
MKYLIIITLLLTSLSAKDLNWLHDYQSALILAKMQNKDVYLFIGADECRFCDKFKDETLSNKEVIKTLREDFILLYMSRDQHQIPKRFKTKGVPQHYFLTPEGKIILTTNGSREIPGFYMLLEEVDLLKED